MEGAAARNLAGLILGCALGVIGFIRVAAGPWLGGDFGEHWMAVGITVAIALVGVVAWGTLIGALFPVLLKRLGADPAASSAPLVATFIDVTGILLYFNIAMLFLKRQAALNSPVSCRGWSGPGGT